MIKSKQAGASINISSYASLDVNYLRSSYGATKTFNHYLSLGESIANYRSVDFLTVLPGWVSTGLTGMARPGLLVSTVKETVEGSLKCLGQKFQNFGAVRHVLFGEIVKVLYEFFPKKVVADLIKGPIK